MGVVSCSGHNDLKDGFDMPFKESAIYLGMNYLGHVHAWIDSNNIGEEASKQLGKSIDFFCPNKTLLGC